MTHLKIINFFFNKSYFDTENVKFDPTMFEIQRWID